METIKLYDEDSYQTQFNATVVDIKDHQVILDQTLFFPEEGGQTCDLGTINTYKVEDVQLRNGIIYHTISNHNLHIGDQVTGEIDFSHRFSNMQNHSAEHIVSGIIHSLYGYDNIGFHLSEQEVTCDFNGPLTEAELRDIENRVNQAIIENHPIYTYYPSDIESLDYRSKKEINEAIRIVEIKDVDMCACCAPHVSYTGEIGLFKIIKSTNMKKGIRLNILAGKRALKYVQRQDEILTNLYQLLSANEDSLEKYVKQLVEDKGLLEKKIGDLLKDKYVSLLKEEPYLFVEDLSTNVQKNIIDEAGEVHQCLLFVGDNTKGYRFMIKGEDITNTMNILRKHGAKGGGNATYAQGYIKESKETIEEWLKEDA